MQPPRRVVTGLDANGRSCVLFDDPASTVIWSTAESPADNRGVADAGGGPFVFPLQGTLFTFYDFPPGYRSEMHATDTVDYIVVVAGEVAFATETGETVVRAGDVLVDRGIVHAWRNDSGAPCRIMNILCAAKPVGEGATMAGELHI